MYSDSHVHLEMFQPGELPTVIERAKAAGLVLIVTSGMDLKSSGEGVAIANTYDIVYANVGIHPWEASKPLSEEEMQKFSDLAKANSRVVAMGEIGLDSKAATSRDSQLDVFRKLIRVGRECRLPLVVHARGEHVETLQIFREEKVPDLGGIIHEFNPDENFVRECLDMGLYITAGRGINRADRLDIELLHKIIRDDVPMDRLVIETDAAPSYDSGVGPKVQPADVLEVAKTVAQLKRISVEEVGKAATANLKRALHIAS